MNFAEQFDQKLSHDSPVSIGGERFSFESKTGFVQHQETSKVVVVPDAHLLFSGEYVRIGNDLIISGQDQKFVVGNYFKGEGRPSLATKDGATLSGNIIDALTGHVHYAQATAPVPSQIIGHVLKLAGSATVIRNGVSIELHIGDAVQKGDVVQTGGDSSIGLTFVDGSAFGMTSNARMVLNEMIYDPNGSSNSSLISLVQGTITFVAGQTAKNGNMRVETPVATMGIRGTAVLVEIAANDGPTKFSVLVEPDGHTGSYNLYDKVSGQLIGTVSQAGQVTYVSSLGLGQPPSAVEQLKTLQDQQSEKAIIQQVFQLYFPNYNPDSKPNSTKHGSSGGNNLAEIIIGTATFNGQTAISQIELKFNPPTPDGTGTGPTSRIFYNTKAIFSADTVKSTQTFVTTEKSFKIADVVHIDDPDIANGPFYDIATPFVAGSAVIKSAVSTNPHLSAEFLSQFLHINQKTGVVTFDRLDFNFLSKGESVTFMLQVTSQSGPDTAIVLIPIIITGENDLPNGAPTIVTGPMTDVDGAVKEDTHVNPLNAVATNGTITFQDVDLSDTHTAAFEFTSSSSSLPGFTGGTHLGSFTIDPVSEDATDTQNTGTVTWHFTLSDDDPVLQSLSEGQTITQVYTIKITDEHGAFVTQTITIIITGTNDAPVLAADVLPVHQAEEVFNATNLTVEDVVSGSLTFVDIDLSDTHQVSATLNSGADAVKWSGGSVADIPAETLAALTSAMDAIVSDSTGTGHGSVTWTFKIPDHYLDFLADGQTLTLVYDIQVKDYYKGVWLGTYSTQQVTVLIAAANDRPVITAIDTVAAVQEDTNVAPGNLLKNTGTVIFADADLTDTHHAHAIYNNDAAAHNGAYISTALAAALAAALTVPTSTLAANDHSFDWSFVLDNSLVQYLAEGETITLSYAITIQDNSGVSANDTSAPVKIVHITITGTNDKPVVAAALTDSANEGAYSFTKDLLTGATDVDHGETATLSIKNGTLKFSIDGGSPTSTIPDGLSLANDGHTLTIDPKSAAFDALAVGEHMTIVLNYDVMDVHGAIVHQTETITINGTNDKPVVAAALTDSANEGAYSFTKDLLTGATDVDHGETATLSIKNGTLKFSIDGGSPTSTIPDGLSLANDGHTLTIDPKSAAFDALAYGEHKTIVVSYDIADMHGAIVHQTETITINGTNDDPILDIANQYVTESVAVRGFSLTHTFTLHDLLAKDVDADSNETFTLTATAEHGKLSLPGSEHGLSVHGEGTDTLCVTGTLDDINATLQGSANGLTYSTGLLDSRVEHIALVLTDNHGGSETLNFVFQQNDFDSGTLRGTDGKDVIFSNWGNDSMWGKADSDVFVFDGLKGRDVINDFHQGEDIITIAHAFNSYADLLAHTSDVHGNAVISTGPHGPGSITLVGIKTADLHQSDFHIVA